jgi:hypothetical protein
MAAIAAALSSCAPGFAGQASATIAVPAASLHAAYYVGLGFDACSTPSEADMSAWAASPFRALNVYIGGVNRACSQPNLTSSWVSTETKAGWGIIPTYVGLQAPGNSCGCAAITPSEASTEGAAAAADAVSELESLGVGAGNPVYYDMEGYTTGGTASSAVLTFLEAWTKALHGDGYVSGVYSSAGSGITDLVSLYGTSYVEPDDIWIADWNGQQTTSDPAVPAADWADHQRIHQYNGGKNLEYGGVTINVDGDYLDGAVVSASATPGAPTSVSAVAGNRSALVSWKAPASGTVTGYEVTSSPGKHLTVVLATFTSVVVAGLVNGTAYTFSVVAESAGGTGPASLPSTAVTATNSSTLPGQPRSVKATAGSGGVTVTWVAPRTNGGAAISAYYVTATPGGQTVQVAGSVLEATFTGLSSTSYSFVVTALSARGPGAPSAHSNSARPLRVRGA